MRKSLLSFLVLLFPLMTQKFAQNQLGCRNAPRLRMKLLYLKSIKTFRFLFLTVLGIGVCLVFLLSSIIILNISIFLYAPLGAGTKMWLGLMFAAVYLFAAIGAYSFVFSQKKWLFIFHAQNILKDEEGIFPLEKSKSEAVNTGI